MIIIRSGSLDDMHSMLWYVYAACCGTGDVCEYSCYASYKVCTTNASMRYLTTISSECSWGLSVIRIVAHKFYFFKTARKICRIFKRTSKILQSKSGNIFRTVVWLKTCMFVEHWSGRNLYLANIDYRCSDFHRFNFINFKCWMNLF